MSGSYKYSFNLKVEFVLWIFIIFNLYYISLLKETQIEMVLPAGWIFLVSISRQNIFQRPLFGRQLSVFIDILTTNDLGTTWPQKPIKMFLLSSAMCYNIMWIGNQMAWWRRFLNVKASNICMTWVKTTRQLYIYVGRSSKATLYIYGIFSLLFHGHLQSIKDGKTLR